MTQAPSTAAYQKHRADTLRGLSHARMLKTARDLLKFNQKNGVRYTKRVKEALGVS